MYIASELITNGGPSAPVWAFLTAITLGIIGIIGQQISSKRTAKDAKIEASKAAANAQKAQENTENLANGFASSVGRKLDRIIRKQDSIETAFRDHLEWHVDNPPQKRIGHETKD